MWDPRWQNARCSTSEDGKAGCDHAQAFRSTFICEAFLGCQSWLHYRATHPVLDAQNKSPQAAISAGSPAPALRAFRHIAVPQTTPGSPQPRACSRSLWRS